MRAGKCRTDTMGHDVATSTLILTYMTDHALSRSSEQQIGDLEKATPCRAIVGAMPYVTPCGTLDGQSVA